MEIGDAVGFETRMADGVPQDARFVISVLNGEQNAAGKAHDERRRHRRETFVAPAELEVLGDARPPRTAIFTRDANRWGVGFVTQRPLPTGRDATLRIWTGKVSGEAAGSGLGSSGLGSGSGSGSGELLMVRSCVLRCREVLPGWFEGAVLFYHEEPRLERLSRKE